MKIKKNLGQHILHEKYFLKKIASFCPIEEKEVIEIGAGTGNLTEYLSKKAKKVYAIEKDPEACQILSSLGLMNVEIINQDILELDLNFFNGGAAAGNLPYYISSPIIRKFLKYKDKFKSGCFLLQMELAKRFTSSRGRNTTPLAILLYNFYQAKIEFHISPGAFTPPPKVYSSFVVFIRREKPLYRITLRSFESFLKVCFSERRKTLFNNLKKKYPEKFLDLPRNLRPEELDLEGFFKVYSDIMIKNGEKI